MSHASPLKRLFTGRFNVQTDGREALQLSLVLWVGVTLFASVGALLVGNLQRVGDYASMLLSLGTAVACAWGMIVIFRALAGRSLWLAVLILTLTICACATVQTLAEYGLILMVDSIYPDSRRPPQGAFTIFTVGVVYLSVFATNLALIWLTSANRALRTQSERLARSEAEGLKAELAALRLKLNPHFMFNALSAADGLIGSGRQAEGRQMIQRLSGFLRTSFDVGVGDITLDEELSVIGDYLEVERVRFGKRLVVRMDIDPEVGGVMVPSLLLQPLVENAVKYAVAPSVKPVTLRIGAHREGRRVIIVVEDDGVAAGAATAGGAGVGQSATRSRLAIRYGEAARFSTMQDEAGYRVEIELPMDQVSA